MTRGSSCRRAYNEIQHCDIPRSLPSQILGTDFREDPGKNPLCSDFMRSPYINPQNILIFRVYFSDFATTRNRSIILYHFAIQQVTCKYGKFIIDLILFGLP